MSAGEAVGTTVFEWAREALGVTINEMFGQTEMNYIVGNSHTLWPAKPGSMGRPYPGHRIAVIDDDGNEVAARRGRATSRCNRIAPDGTPDPGVLPRVLGQRRGDARRSTPATGAAPATSATRDEDGYLWYQGRADDMFKVAGYRIGPSEIENCLVKHPAVANAAVVPIARRDARQRRQGVRRARRRVTRRRRRSRTRSSEHVRKLLAPYEYPKEIEFIDALPMTTTGKVQRQGAARTRAQRKRLSVRRSGPRHARSLRSRLSRLLPASARGTRDA